MSEKILVSDNSQLTCDYCGTKSNVFYIFGGPDSSYTIVLCLAHRNYFVEKIYIEVANKIARDKIAEQHKKQLEYERKRLEVVPID